MNPREPSNFAHSKIFKNEFFQKFSPFRENREKKFSGKILTKRKYEDFRNFGFYRFGYWISYVNLVLLSNPKNLLLPDPGDRK